MSESLILGDEGSVQVVLTSLSLRLPQTVEHLLSCDAPTGNHLETLQRGFLPVQTDPARCFIVLHKLFPCPNGVLSREHLVDTVEKDIYERPEDAQGVLDFRAGSILKNRVTCGSALLATAETFFMAATPVDNHSSCAAM